MLLRKFSQTLKVSLALLFSVLSSGILQAAPASAFSMTNPDGVYDKVYVCKYVGTPGIDERLQTGDNPISVNTNSLKDFTGLGDYFNDKQEKSVAIAWDNKDNVEPPVSMCPSTTVTIPVEPTSTDPCNASGVTNNVEWTSTLPADTATIDWSESDDGATRTATLIGSNITWDDGTTSAKVFSLPADSGEMCEETVTTVPVPAMLETIDPCNLEDVTNNVAWKDALPADTATIDWSESNNGATRTATLIGANVKWSDSTTAPKVFNLPADSGEMCEDSESVELCHATGSESNPFVRITVSAAGAFNGHYGNDHQNGEDIIPPFYYNGTEYSQNWDAAGQAIYQSDDCASLAPVSCPVPGNGGVITQNSAGWNLVGDAQFVDGAVSINSGSWVDGGISFTGTYSLAEVEKLGWTIDTSGVTGPYGVGILLETENGDVIHYEPEPYTDDFWSNDPVLPMNGGGQGGPYSGSLQDALNTIGNVTIVKTTFVFTSAEVNEGVLLTSLSFDCTTYTFDEVEEVQPVADIDATVICAPNGALVTLTNSGDADGTAMVNGQPYTVKANDSLQVTVPFDMGTPFIVDVTVMVGNTTVLTENLNCTPGRGADTPTTPTTPGQVLGLTTTTPQTLSASTELPDTLPATGGEANPFLILVASLIAYGAAYFLQGRRLLGRKEALSA